MLSRESNSTEKFIHGVKVLMAKNYIDNLSEEVKKGMKEKVAQGYYPGKAPIGYINTDLNGKRVIDINPKESEFIQRIYDWYLTGNYSYKGIRKKAKEEGYLAIINTKLSTSHVEKILKSNFYYGSFEWKGDVYEGKHPSIISKSQWDEVQTLIAKRSNNNAGKSRKDFPYINMMKCSYCGCSITAEIKKKKYIYYHCTNHKGNCPQPYFNESKIEAQFQKMLSLIKVDKTMLEWIKEALQRSHKDKIQYHKETIKKLNRQFDSLQIKVNQMYDDKLNGLIDESFWKTKYTEYRDNQNEIQISLKAHQKADETYIHSGIQLLELAQNASNIFKKGSSSQKREILSFVLSNSKLTSENIEFEFKNPFDMLVEVSKSKNWLGWLDEIRTYFMSKKYVVSTV